jgi:integrase
VKLLEWDEVHFDKKMVLIPPEKAKAKETIVVPLNAETLAVLKSVQGKHEKYVFVKEGKVIADPNCRDWRRALSEAQITDFRWHDLRHTWASWHVQNGTPLYVLKELGGWKTLSMVEKYAHLAPEHLAQYVDNVLVTDNSHGTNTEQAA